MSGPDASSSAGAEPVGSVAEEAVKLLRAMSGSSGSSASDSAASGSETSDHVCSTTWCPVCQVVGFVRDNPDAVAAVTRSATDLARSLRDLVDTALSPPRTTTPSPEENQ